jgi:hypothetical protein
MFVGPQDSAPPGEGRNQHQERRFWQMEISEHGSYYAKLKSRIDKDVGLATLRGDPAIGGAPPFGKLRAGSKLILLG